VGKITIQPESTTSVCFRKCVIVFGNVHTRNAMSLSYVHYQPEFMAFFCVW